MFFSLGKGENQINGNIKRGGKGRPTIDTHREKYG